MESNRPQPRLAKKPSFKGKPAPQVRQTRTSYKRMVQANPLLAMNEIELRKIPGLSEATIKSVLANPLIGPSVPSTSQQLGNNTAFKKPLGNGVPKNPRNPIALNKKPISKSLSKLTEGGPKQEHPKNMQFSKSKPTNKEPNMQKNKACKVSNIDKQNMSRSEECLNRNDDFEIISPIESNEPERKKFVFKTPTANKRRSQTFHTPLSNRRTSLFHVSTPAPHHLLKLQEKLNKWLESRGKPPVLFHNLRTFSNQNAEQSLIEENKENQDISKCDKLNNEADNAVGKDSNPTTSNPDLEQCAKEAVYELMTLIEDDFPANQCASWLQMIKEKYPNILNEPVYWECRAAVEKSMGNVYNAVEFYKEAIVHGAEVSAVNQSLDQLLKKFSLLNINTEMSANDSVYKRNFNRKNDQSFDNKRYAIPVRRSTRLSRSAYTNTSGVQLCESLRELENSADITFRSNNALC